MSVRPLNRKLKLCLTSWRGRTLLKIFPLIRHSLTQKKRAVLPISSLHKERNHFLMNIMVQVILKQGQVEVGTTDLGPDYTSAVLIHRNVVEELNGTIRVSTAA